MAVETKSISGGDRAISSLFNFKKAEKKADDVNILIEKCSYSKECLAELYHMFKQSVFAVAFSITSDYHLSEDCVSETFIRLTQTKNFNSSKGDGKGYILTLARNVAFELRRRHKRDNTSFVIQNYGDAEQTVEDSIYINQLMKHLNDKQRQIVVLKCCAELTFKQIAKIMKCPESTVKSRYQKAISVLNEKAGE